MQHVKLRFNGNNELVEIKLTVIYKSNKSLGSGYFKSITGEIVYISDLRNATAVFDKVDDTLKLVTFHPSI